MSAVVHPRLRPRRSGRLASWWGRAWGRAVEEAAYDAADLRRARALARAGAVGAIGVRAGSVAAAVRVGAGSAETVTVDATLPVLDAGGRAMLVELVAAEAGRVADLLAGELPIELVEEAEDAGVELLPAGGELGTACPCGHWVDPCEHALAVLTQVGWLLDTDPFVLLALRGVPREALLADLHAGSARPDGADGGDGVDEVDEVDEVSLELGADAARRAAAVLAALEAGDPDSVDDLFR